MRRMFLWIVLFCVAAVLVPTSPAQTKLDKTTTIDVSGVAPRDVFASLSRLLGYELVIAPEIQKPVTMHVENVTVRTALTALSENLGCRWSIDGSSLRIQPAGSAKPGPARTGLMTGIGPGRGPGVGSGTGPGVGSGRGSGSGGGIGKSAFDRIMGCRTPSPFRFDNVSLNSVTDALGKACKVDIRLDESIKARLVTIDLSNHTFLSALKAISKLDDSQKPMSISLMSSPSNKMILIYIKNRKKTPE